MTPSTPHPARSLASLTQAAMIGAAILVAHQVVAKAARDALFLAEFPVTDLPKIIGLAAVIAVASALVYANIILRWRPGTILQATLAISAGLHLVEFALINPWRGVVVVLVYLHIVSSSSITLSLFWGIAGEAFSPGDAKAHFGRIAAAGGVVGGLAAARLSSAVSVDSLLVMMALLQAAAIGAVAILQRKGELSTAAASGRGLVETAREAVARAPFLRSLALLVLLTTISGVIIDFLFKGSAAAAYGRGPELASFFAKFYTGTQLASFLLQVVVTPWALRAFGLSRTVATLPLALTGGGLLSVWAPGLLPFTSTRVGETVLKGSLFRAGYEQFFTAIPLGERRAVKTAIDVGCDRAGELIAAGIVQLFLIGGLDAATRPLLLLMIGLGGACLWISARTDPAYLRALEQGLLHRATELRADEDEELNSMAGLSEWMNSMPRLPAGSTPRAVIDDQPTEATSSRHERLPADPALEHLRVLRSGKAADVKGALAADDPFDSVWVSQVIRLLAWDAVTEDARHYLERHAPRIAGQLADALVDANQDFSVRRRIPRILARVPTQGVVEALIEALDDPRFEIRFQCSRGLDFLHRTAPSLRFDASRLWAVVERELSVSRAIWEGRRLLDKRDSSDGQFSYLDDILQDRAHQSMEHVFSLLATMLPREPLKIAFRALHGDDRLLRGLALEYLETVLSSSTLTLFRGMLDSNAPASAHRPAQEVLESLMASQESIRLQVKIASADAPEPDQPPRPATRA